MTIETFNDSFARKKNYLTGTETGTKLSAVAVFIFLSISSKTCLLPLLVSLVCLGLLLSVNIPAKTLLLRLAPPVGFAAAAALLQFFFASGAQGWERGLLLSSRVMAAASSMLLLGMTTPLNKLLDVAHRLKIPPLWIEIALLTTRYIFVILDDAAVIRDAQRARLGYGSAGRSLRSAGELAGAAVIKAYDHAMAIHQAMIARGYKETGPGERDDESP